MQLNGNAQEKKKSCIISPPKLPRALRYPSGFTVRNWGGGEIIA